MTYLLVEPNLCTCAVRARYIYKRGQATWNLILIGMSKGKENSVKTLVSRGAGITKGVVG